MDDLKVGPFLHLDAPVDRIHIDHRPLTFSLPFWIPASPVPLLGEGELAPFCSSRHLLMLENVAERKIKDPPDCLSL